MNMTRVGLEANLLCDMCNTPRVILEVIRKEKLGILEEAASEALEKEHRKLAETETDPQTTAMHRLLAETQNQMRTEGLVRLKMRCPNHPKVVEYDLFWGDFPDNTALIKSNMLRCVKDGKLVEMIDTQQSGRNTNLTIRCTNHGKGKRKISSSIYDVLMSADTPSPTSPPVTTTPPRPPLPSTAVEVPSTAPRKDAPPPTTTQVNFCPECGRRTRKAGDKFCMGCGASLRV